MSNYIDQKLDEAIRKVAEDHYQYVEDLTLEQFGDALIQALRSGDFMRVVCVDAQSVIYRPYQEKQRLEARIAELEKELREKARNNE